MIGRVKGSSSKRLSEKGVLGFAWQNGYGAFSVSESSVEAVTAYISDQAEHHRKFSYQEELRELLKRHRVPGLKPWVVPGTSCLAAIVLSLLDNSHSPIEAPHNYLSAISSEAMSRKKSLIAPDSRSAASNSH
jgi:Transposase IS200 like